MSFSVELPVDTAPALVPATVADTLQTLRQWSEVGWLRRLDSALAVWVADLDAQAEPALLVATALLTHLEGRGHTCLPLAPLLQRPAAVLGWSADALSALELLWAVLPSTLSGWRAALLNSPVVYDAAGLGQDTGQPLVLSGAVEAPRLYLRRYWTYEQAVAQQIAERTAVPVPVEPAMVRGWLDRLFGATSVGEATFGWQKLACAMALRGRLSVITGGPGTGKTYTAARLLALLFAVDEHPERLRVALAAPTGKAAARLKQSIDAALAGLHERLGATLNLPMLTQRMGPARTLHALLGARPDTRQFQYHAGRLLDVDVLIVDEASMVHLEMMAALLAALPASARVIFLGDKDQLASVEAGAVLGDLCRDAQAGRYSAETADYAQAATGQSLPVEYLVPSGSAAPPLAQHTVMLRESRRFVGPIGQLALAVNTGEVAAARRLLAHGTAQVLWRLDASDAGAILPLAVQGRPGALACYRCYLEQLAQRPVGGSVPEQEDWVRRVLAEFERFRLLCAVREGDWGAIGLNRAVERALQRAGLLHPRGEWYLGRPVMVTRNDPVLGVFNGDIGITLPAIQETGRAAGSLRVYFADGPQLRSVGVSRLAHVETAFAMTVHKSQGSEFEHTVLVLPPQAGPVLSRELVYTGITRARLAFTLVSAQPGLLTAAMQQRTQRASGLQDLLQHGWAA
ncbi:MULTISPECIES: exodeoxyribonuclease V subunit alpha [Giesbergeria]|uniref:RecBCD enzyme subunit RecD n=1 Tax=Giesbergeria sinuosa TaxID=80883 RepID=A0ABV9QFH7_9BURK